MYSGVIQLSGDGEQYWIDKQVDYVEGDQVVNDVGEDKDYWQVGVYVDEYWMNNVVYGVDYVVLDQQYGVSGGVFVLVKLDN